MLLTDTMSEYANFQEFMDTVGTMGPGQYPPKPRALLVAAPEDPAWPPAWFINKANTLNRLQGAGYVIILVAFLIGPGWLQFSIAAVAVIYALQIWKDAEVETKVHDREDKLKQEGRLLPKTLPNPLYNVIPFSM
jgi:hypothetical protein